MKLKTQLVMTSAVEPLLLLQDIELFADGSGAKSLLTVRSGHFECHAIPFYIDDPLRFCREVVRLHKTLKGRCRLGHQYEPEFIEFELGIRGQLRISGELTDYVNQQRMTLSLTVDQTYLQSLVLSSVSLVKEVEAIEDANHPIRSRLKRLLACNE